MLFLLKTKDMNSHKKRIDFLMIYIYYPIMIIFRGNERRFLMGKDKLRLTVICSILIMLLSLPLTGGAQSRKTQPPNPQSESVTFEYLTERNASLEMEGFMFASGLKTDQQGRLNGNGTEVLGVKWCGSGFIVKGDGTLVTNYHVARRALRGKAIFEDGATFDITHIKVYDPINDIAVMKIRANKRFSTVNLGNSDELRPMDKVLAVGNSLCRRLAVTDGTVNQIIRNEKDNDVVQIRHSAPIAPGNSGGALFKGNKVVGINVATRPPWQIHYAIPINKLKRLLLPPYDTQTLYLPDVFPTNIQSIVQKVKLLDGVNQQVPAAAEGKPGAWTTQYEFLALEDLLIHLDSPGKDLLLAVFDSQGQTIGFSDIRGKDFEILLMSSDHYQRVRIAVINADSTPASFGLKIYKIAW
jgi:hypothetical protein